jgi:hypothetical protein
VLRVDALAVLDELEQPLPHSPSILDFGLPEELLSNLLIGRKATAASQQLAKSSRTRPLPLSLSTPRCALVDGCFSEVPIVVRDDFPVEVRCFEASFAAVANAAAEDKGGLRALLGKLCPEEEASWTEEAD